MSATKYLKGECQKCRGHLEFPAETIGVEIQCPHCGEPTELLLLSLPEEPLVPRRVVVWTAVAVFVLALGLVGTLVALNRAQQFLARQRPQAPTQAPVAMPVPGTSTNEFHITPVRLEKVQGSSLLYAVGILRNDSNRQRFGVRIDLNVFDQTGQKLGATRDYRQTLEPGAEWQFRALVNPPNAVSAQLGSITEEK